MLRVHGRNFGPSNDLKETFMNLSLWMLMLVWTVSCSTDDSTQKPPEVAPVEEASPVERVAIDDEVEKEDGQPQTSAEKDQSENEGLEEKLGDIDEGESVSRDEEMRL